MIRTDPPASACIVPVPPQLPKPYVEVIATPADNVTSGDIALSPVNPEDIIPVLVEISGHFALSVRSFPAVEVAENKADISIVIGSLVTPLNVAVRVNPT